MPSLFCTLLVIGFSASLLGCATPRRPIKINHAHRIDNLSRQLKVLTLENEALRVENQVLRKKVENSAVSVQQVELPVMKTELDHWQFIQKAHAEKDSLRLEVAVDLLKRKFPKSVHGDEASYLLANSFYKQKKWIQALTAYDYLLKNFPQSDKRSRAVLAKALIYKSMNIPQAARTLLQEVMENHADSPEAYQARAELETMSVPAQSTVK